MQHALCRAERDLALAGRHTHCLCSVFHLQAYYKVHGASLLRACRAYASGQARIGQELAAAPSPVPAADPASLDPSSGSGVGASAPESELPGQGSGAPAQAAPEPDTALSSTAGGVAGGEGAAGALAEGAGAADVDAGEPCTSEGFRLVMRQVLPRLEAALAAL